MIKLQIISTFSRGSYAASEALWHEVAHCAAKAGHDVEISLTQRAALSRRTVALKAAGCQLKFHKVWPDSRLGRLSRKAWDISFGESALRFGLADDADVYLLNVGTLIEASVEPYASYLMNLGRPFSIIVHNSPEIRQYSTKVINKLSIILSKAVRVYFVSQRLWDTTEEQLLQRIPGGETVRNPVNLDSVGMEPWPDDDCLRMALVGRWNIWVKGQVRALHALSASKWRHRNWSLSFFGSGPDAAVIQKAIDFYDLQDKVNVVGFVNNIRKDIWQSHHALLMPSMLEGMPLTLVEAMLCGRPAVVSDVGGASELVHDGINGFLAGSPFSNQFEAALENLWVAKECLPQMGKRAHEDAMQYVPTDAGMQLLHKIARSLSNSKSTNAFVDTD